MTWPTHEDVERVAIAVEQGTATGVQVARLCAMARGLMLQRAELIVQRAEWRDQRAALEKELAELRAQASGPEKLGP